MDLQSNEARVPVNPYSPPAAYGGQVAPSEAWARYGGFVPLRTRMQMAAFAVALAVVGTLMLDLAQLSFADQLKANPSDAGANAIVFVCSLATVFTSLAAALFYSLWLHRAASNVRALGRYMSFTPGQSVGVFFIPFLNWFKPYHAVVELWAASDPQAPRQSGMLQWWWGTWIAASMLHTVSGRIPNMSVSGSIGLVGSCVGAIAAVGCIAVMREISRRQLQSAPNVER